MLNQDDSYEVYTDGSCWTKDRIGSYAWIAIDSDGNEILKGDVDLDTTISRMELLGPISALEYIWDHCGPSVILVQSDSLYVIEGITDRTRKRKVNKDLWMQFDQIVDAHALVAFDHVRGHSGHHYNELVDQYAGNLRREAQNLYE